jgi:hypothetical protein
MSIVICKTLWKIQIHSQNSNLLLIRVKKFVKSNENYKKKKFSVSSIYWL